MLYYIDNFPIQPFYNAILLLLFGHSVLLRKEKRALIFFARAQLTTERSYADMHMYVFIQYTALKFKKPYEPKIIIL